MLTTLLLSSFILLTSSSFAEAHSISTCSKLHSGKCVSGSVKSDSLGQKVRLPGGTWIDCAGDCKNKLREKTVDFWYEQKLRN